jgi:ABC-type Fe3+-hydroxamate transport system substrate-binding protein
MRACPSSVLYLSPINRLLRRLLLVAAFLAWLPVHADAAPSPNGADQERERLIAMDWTLLETLVALGYPPIGAADLGGYGTWVGKPPLPEDIVDIGLRTQPNLELLSQLAPDQFLLAPLFANLKPLLSRIAPVEVIPLYAAEGPFWSNLREFTRAVAHFTPDPESADALIARVEARLETLAETLPDDLPPLLVVQFMDGRHVRVFGKHSLYSAVLKRLGVATAWQGKTNYWGFSVVGIEALADADNLLGDEARMVVVEPLPAGVQAQLESSGLWQSLPSVARGDVLYLPPAWSFGGLPSAQRFAELISAAVQE